MFVLWIISAFVVAGIVALVVISHRREWKMTSSTTGRVVRCEEREVRDEHERREETAVIVSYEVAGRACEVRRVFAGRMAWRYPESCELEVKYNPAEPEMATFE